MISPAAHNATEVATNKADAKKFDTGIPMSLLYMTVVAVVVLWFLWGLSMWLLSPKVSADAARIAAAGQMGDLFGGINALFSGLAFAVLIFTMHLQRKELSFQRQELKETREVFEKQEKQMQGQNNSLKKQIFESRFFQWMTLHHSLVNDLRSNIAQGRQVLSHIRDFYFSNIENALTNDLGAGPFEEREELESTLRQLAGEEFTKHKEKHRALLVEAFQPLRKQFRNELVHYFENLYAIFDFLLHSDISISDRNFYGNVLKAQLSVAELVLLFAYGLTEQGERFNVVFKSFGLFSNLTDADLYAAEHRGYYEDECYRLSFIPAEPIYL